MPEVNVPIDMYESAAELIIVMPLGGVDKSSVSLKLREYRLVVRGERVRPTFKEGVMPLQERCYRWSIEKVIDLPEDVYFDRIHSELSPTNVLTVIVPKVVKPEEIIVDIK